ncbi:MAG: NTP transferase domain-containing protein [Thermodesulfobacteriota bacterium]|nr:NTP transferase domain-containing protein [Thermodesulfobacteriota bacterium]
MMGDVVVIILAAGKGTRMKSDKAKVLHELAGMCMIRYVVETALAVADEVVVVIGHQAQAVRKALSDHPSLQFALQKEQLGTGHAVMTAMPLVAKGARDAVILCGDTPLIKAQTIYGLVRRHRTQGADLTLATTKLEQPFGYGRIMTDDQGRVLAIVEESDASALEKRITTVNTGTYCVKMEFLKESLPDLSNDNAQGEFYLTDVVEYAHRKGMAAATLEIQDSFEVLGINTTEELLHAEGLITEINRRKA